MNTGLNPESEAGKPAADQRFAANLGEVIVTFCAQVLDLFGGRAVAVPGRVSGVPKGSDSIYVEVDGKAKLEPLRSTISLMLYANSSFTASHSPHCVVFVKQ